MIRAQDPPEGMERVIAAELEDVAARREWHGFDGPAPVSPAPPGDLAGLALSGGGIRSATFCLGVLQSLNRLKLLPAFDYVSTVSGGGYVGAWWAAWLARPPLLDSRDVNWERLVERLRPPADRICHHVMARCDERSLELPHATEPSGVSQELKRDVLLLLNEMLRSDGFINLESASSFSISPKTHSVLIRGRNEKWSSGDDNMVRLRRMVLQDVLSDTIAAKNIFPPTEDIESNRCGDYVDPEGYGEGSVNAWEDPIHHIRLFSNYLTPRKGILSTDTWRAVTFIVRSLILTWLILLPILFAAVLLSRLYFLAQPRSNIDWESTPLSYPTPDDDIQRRHWNREVGPVANILGLTAPWPESDGRVERAKFASWIPGMWLGIGGVLTLFWVTSGRERPTLRDMGVTVMGLIALALAVYLFWLGWKGQQKYRADEWNTWLLLPIGIAAVGAGWALWPVFSEPRAFFVHTARRRNLINTCQMRLLVLTVIAAIWLFVGGFAAQLAEHMWGYTMSIGSAGAAAASVFTAIRAAPWGGGDRKETGTPNLATRIIIAITPPLMLCLLLLMAAWGVDFILEEYAHRLVGQQTTQAAHIRLQFGVMGFCFFVFCLYSSYEVYNRFSRLDGWAWVAFILALVTAVATILFTLIGANWKWVWTWIANIPQSAIDHPCFGMAIVIMTLTAVLMAWIVGVGYTVDPNSVSLHEFYKARLVRAYLGASNKARAEQRTEITEAVPGDDLPLRALNSGSWGAPHFLFNTTLNLVAGRDLATAQRSAASFVLNRLFCGSLRTGYRATAEYMDGQLSVGTAVATSGAAVSPNMGSRSPTASVAMFLTSLNIRLGFWAPTPSRSFWRSPQARLWPIYMLREFFSQTNDLNSYCYLSDGGHFDNTGLYALAERGCRCIVMVDCGADPKPCFEDVGNAVRRIRIDFGAEVCLDFTSLSRDAASNRATSHFVAGTITYSAEHLRRLGVSPHELEGDSGLIRRTGRIIWVKPSMMSRETVDVRQYALENPVFPQQTTMNQWFDEAQFESYRKLGMISVETCLAEASRWVLKWSADNSAASPRLLRRILEDVAAFP